MSHRPARTIGTAHLPTNPSIQNRRIALNPAPDRDVVNGQTSFRHDFLQVAIGQRVSQIPSHTENNHDVLEVSSTEQCRPPLAHRVTVSDDPRQFATEPMRGQQDFVNNRCEVSWHRRHFTVVRSAVKAVSQRSSTPSTSSASRWIVRRKPIRFRTARIGRFSVVVVATTRCNFSSRAISSRRRRSSLAKPLP
jgi:hypothetical protein